MRDDDKPSQDMLGAPSGRLYVSRGLSKRVLAILAMLSFVLAALAPLSYTTPQAFAEESVVVAESSNAYRHNPIYNPTAMEDVMVNPNAVYGFSPKPDSGSLKEYATYDWTDPEVVAQIHDTRLAYHKQGSQLYEMAMSMMDQGASMEETARSVSAKRNQNRLDSYEGNPEGLAKVKQRNLEKYGNESGPTPEWLFERYGSWEAVLENAFNTNPGMDACCGLYDENWEKYVFFGQIPLCTVSFDVAGHGRAPAVQRVYAGEMASRPEDPAEEGWLFEGWFAEGSDEPFDFSVPVAASTTVVAAWTKSPDPVPGTVRLHASVANDVPIDGAAIAIRAEDLLTAAEADRVKAGEDADVWLDVGPATATDEEKARMLEAAGKELGNDATVACYLNIGLRKRLSNDVADTAITELEKPVAVTLTLSKSLAPSNVGNRDWYVVREHGGELTLASASCEARKRDISFATDRFSVFGVVYGPIAFTDSPAVPSDANASPVTTKREALPATGDASLQPMALAFAAFVALIAKPVASRMKRSL